MRRQPLPGILGAFGYGTKGSQMSAVEKRGHAGEVVSSGVVFQESERMLDETV